MKDIKQKLAEKYENSKDLLDILSEFNLDALIFKTINLIQKKIRGNKIEDLPKLSGIILNEVNSIISNIKEPEKKRKIEYLLSDIFQEYILEIYKAKNAESIIDELKDNIKNACEYRGYDSNEIFELLGLEKHSVLIPKKHEKKLYYEWLGKEIELDEISKDLFDKKIIYSIKEFKKLFKPFSDTFYVKFNIKYKDEIIVFIQLLKDFKLLKPKGSGNSGHFAPFVNYAVDNENNIFNKKPINKEHARIKKNKIKHLEIKEKMEIIIKSNLLKR